MSNFTRVPASPAGSSIDLNAPFLRSQKPTSYRVDGVRKVVPAPRCSTSSATSVENAEKEIMEKGKGWMNLKGEQDERVLHRFYQLAILVSDRVEMHKILAEQRDNWNHLFHSTITIASVSAASVLAMSSQVQAPGLIIMATILNVASGALMTVVNLEQPSQLAEEQRRAARFFRRLRMEVEATLKIDPQLREHASAFWEQKVGTLHALDGAFPLPLTPNGLEKFPKSVVAAELGPNVGESLSADLEKDENQPPSMSSSSCQWTPLTEAYVKQMVARIGEEKVPELVDFAEKAKLLNLWLARTTPLLALGSALTNVLVCAGIFTSCDQAAGMAATMTVVAYVLHSFSHALQLGSVFEVYRTTAGYYADIEQSVERTLGLPRLRREDWKLFLLKLNLQLGNSSVKQLDSHDANRFL